MVCNELGTQYVSESMQAWSDAWVRWSQKTTMAASRSAPKKKQTHGCNCVVLVSSPYRYSVLLRRRSLTIPPVLHRFPFPPTASRSLGSVPFLPRVFSCRVNTQQAKQASPRRAAERATRRWSPSGVLTWATLALALAALRRTTLFQNSPHTNSNSTRCWPNRHSETYCPYVSTYVPQTSSFKSFRLFLCRNLSPPSAPPFFSAPPRCSVLFRILSTCDLDRWFTFYYGN